MSLRIVFFGTSPFAAQVLSFLLSKKYSIAAVVTRPDRPQGRSLKIAPSAVKETLLAERPEIPLHQPEKASTPEFAAVLREYKADLFVVVAYGEIIKQLLLDIPRLGAINIHASLLPKYRGAAPMQRALMNGESETGITIIDMVLQMDAGAMLEKRQISIPLEMTRGELEEKLIALSCNALEKTLSDLEAGSAKRVEQDPAEVTFAPKISSAETEIHWDQPALQIHNIVRALSPKPGAWCWVYIGEEKKRLKILRTSFLQSQSGKAGELLKNFIVAAGDGSLQLLEVQLEGKKAMRAEEFFNGLRLPISFTPK